MTYDLIQAAREQVAHLTQQAYERAAAEGVLPAGQTITGTVEVPKDSKNGDFASSFALAGAKALKMSPRAIAQAILDHLELEGCYFERAEIAGPGFLNFFYAPSWYGAVLSAVEADPEGYGGSDEGHGQTVSGRAREPSAGHELCKRRGPRFESAEDQRCLVEDANATGCLLFHTTI